MGAIGRGLRAVLDALYFAGGVLAAGFLVMILAIIVAQMAARWFGFTFPGSTDYAGYCMAAASFFAFAHALNRGAHIRVSLLLAALGGGAGGARSGALRSPPRSRSISPITRSGASSGLTSSAT